MIIPRQSIIHCHHQEFCIKTVGNKIIVKTYFQVDWHISLGCKGYIICLLKFKDNWFAPSHLFKDVKAMEMFLLNSTRLEWLNKC